MSQIDMFSSAGCKSEDVIFFGRSPVIIDPSRGIHHKIFRENCYGPRMVEVAGYIDKREQLRILQSSGAARQAYMRRQYPDMDTDNPLDADDIPYYPSNDYGYDYFDCIDHVNTVRNNLESLKRRVDSQSKPVDIPPPADGGKEGAAVT